MTTRHSALPLMAKISMIGIWIETLLYGVNFVTYGLCMFVLLREGKTASVRWVLVVMSTILFILCTIHIGASLRQLLEAFVDVPTDVPEYSTMYWLDFATVPRLLKGYVYCSLVLAQAIFLIWRLYVIFMCDWRVVIFPIIAAAGCVGSAYAASAVSVLQNDGLYNSVMTSLIISAWVFGFTLNASITGGIALRLWQMGRRMASLTAVSTNRFASSIYMVVESGAISAVTHVIVFALFVSNSPAALSGMDVASQIYALVPLLSVVQVALLGRGSVLKGDILTTEPKAQDRMTFEGNRRDSERSDLPFLTP